MTKKELIEKYKGWLKVKGSLQSKTAKQLKILVLTQAINSWEKLSENETLKRVMNIVGTGDLLSQKKQETRLEELRTKYHNDFVAYSNKKLDNEFKRDLEVLWNEYWNKVWNETRPYKKKQINWDIFYLWETWVVQVKTLQAELESLLEKE